MTNRKSFDRISKMQELHLENYVDFSVATAISDYKKSTFGSANVDDGTKSIDKSNCDLVSLDGLNLNSSHLKFNVSWNRLTAVPPQFFINAANLQVIDLSHNQFKAINSSTFGGAGNLTKMDLSFNQIKDIEAGSFKYLEHLKFVNLANNSISVLNFEFSLEHPLETLHLENNRIVKLAGDVCLKSTVTKVHHSWNQLLEMHLPKGNQFYVIVNDTFEGINCISRGTFEIHCSERSFELVYWFDATSNSTESVWKILQHFTDRISILDLSGSFLERIDVIPFERFPFIEWLNLRNTHLIDFDCNCLNGVDFMQIDISSNNLTTVHNVSRLKQFTSLRNFWAGGNNFHETHEIIEHLHPSIQSLDLSGSVVALNLSILRKFRNLKSLTLRTTNLTFVDFDSPTKFDTLFLLDFSHNNFKDEHFPILSRISKQLRTFQCAHCQIENASKLIRNFESGFERLDLFGNSIREIDLEFLPRSIETLNLGANELVRMEKLNRGHFPHLNSLVITNNRIPCEYLKRLIQIWNGSFNDDPDPWQQKHGEDCRFEESYTARNLWQIIAILFSLMIVAIILVKVGLFLLRGRACSAAQKSDRQQIDFINDFVYERSDSLPSCASNIYEEIYSPIVQYDKLQFNISPLPISATNSHYDKPHLDK